MPQITRSTHLPRNTPLTVLAYTIRAALDEARRNPDTQYTVQARGWGHPARVIAPMFDYCPTNVSLPYEFQY